jgi:hypothetical protein
MEKVLQGSRSGYGSGLRAAVTADALEQTASIFVIQRQQEIRFFALHEAQT